jgi:hypothetical protein
LTLVAHAPREARRADDLVDPGVGVASAIACKDLAGNAACDVDPFRLSLKHDLRV